MAIRLDQSCSSIVVVCDDCPSYVRITGANLEAATAVAREHELACHPGSTEVRDRLNMQASRRRRRDTPLAAALAVER